MLTCLFIGKLEFELFGGNLYSVGESLNSEDQQEDRWHRVDERRHWRISVVRPLFFTKAKKIVSDAELNTEFCRTQGQAGVVVVYYYSGVLGVLC
jgi:hypothetical protein